MRAWFKALKYYREQPLDASEIIAPHYKLPAEKYRKSVEGLRWIDYALQDDPLEHRALIETFNEITELKYSNGKVAKKTPIGDAINTELLKVLYR